MLVARWSASAKSLGRLLRSRCAPAVFLVPGGWAAPAALRLAQRPAAAPSPGPPAPSPQLLFFPLPSTSLPAARPSMGRLKNTKGGARPLVQEAAGYEHMPASDAAALAPAAKHKEGRTSSSRKRQPPSHATDSTSLASKEQGGIPLPSPPETQQALPSTPPKRRRKSSKAAAAQEAGTASDQPAPQIRPVAAAEEEEEALGAAAAASPPPAPTKKVKGWRRAGSGSAAAAEVVTQGQAQGRGQRATAHAAVSHGLGMKEAQEGVAEDEGGEEEQVAGTSARKPRRRSSSNPKAQPKAKGKGKTKQAGSENAQEQQQPQGPGALADEEAEPGASQGTEDGDYEEEEEEATAKTPRKRRAPAAGGGGGGRKSKATIGAEVASALASQASIHGDFTLYDLYPHTQAFEQTAFLAPPPGSQHQHAHDPFSAAQQGLAAAKVLKARAKRGKKKQAEEAAAAAAAEEELLQQQQGTEAQEPQAEGAGKERQQGQDQRRQQGQAPDEAQILIRRRILSSPSLIRHRLERGPNSSVLTFHGADFDVVAAAEVARATAPLGLLASAPSSGGPPAPAGEGYVPPMSFHGPPPAVAGTISSSSEGSTSERASAGSASEPSSATEGRVVVGGGNEDLPAGLGTVVLQAAQAVAHTAVQLTRKGQGQGQGTSTGPGSSEGDVSTGAGTGSDSAVAAAAEAAPETRRAGLLSPHGAGSRAVAVEGVMAIPRSAEAVAAAVERVPPLMSMPEVGPDPEFNAPLRTRPWPAVVPNLGYACLCATLRAYDVHTSRDCVQKTFESKGLAHVSGLVLANARDLLALIRWNARHGIQFFRLSSCIFPWMTKYRMEDLPDFPAIKEALFAAGEAARAVGQRLTFHPSEFCKIAGPEERDHWTAQSIAELEVHSKIFDLMGYDKPSPWNKINIHVGATYGDKEATLARFAKVVNERLSPNCRARLTVENDDKGSLYSVRELQELHRACGVPIVFDFHHHKFNTGGWDERTAFEAAIATWPQGVRPVVHWSEARDNKRPQAHSDYVLGPINLHGHEAEVDVMIESKAKELALIRYREVAIHAAALAHASQQQQ